MQTPGLQGRSCSDRELPADCFVAPTALSMATETIETVLFHRILEAELEVEIAKYRSGKLLALEHLRRMPSWKALTNRALVKRLIENIAMLVTDLWIEKWDFSKRVIEKLDIAECNADPARRLSAFQSPAWPRRLKTRILGLQELKICAEWKFRQAVPACPSQTGIHTRFG